MVDSVGFFSALAAGILSFISPCVLPLVPVYLTTITGLSLEELGQKGEKPYFQILIRSLAFCLGLSMVFIALGLTATTFGTFLTEHLRVFEIVAGIIIIIFGIHLTGIIKIGFLLRTFQIQSKPVDPKEKKKPKGIFVFFHPFLMGGAFAFGWTPCVGPILAAVLALAATKETVWEGGLLLAVYSLGLAVPFILASLAFTTFMASYKRFRKYLRAVEIISGVLLILFGILIATHNFTILVGWFSQILPQPKL